MINNLIIKQKSVEIDTEISYAAIEIRYRGEMYIKNNLPNNFIVRKGNNKIIILRFSKDDTIHTDLFEYSGSCNIYYAMMVDKDLNTYDLLVKKPALELYMKKHPSLHGMKPWLNVDDAGNFNVDDFLDYFPEITKKSK